MDSTVYDWPDVAGMLTEIAAAAPTGFRYTKKPSVDQRHDALVCHYFYKGQPDCIIGHLLAKVGFTAADIRDNNCDVMGMCSPWADEGTYRPAIAHRFTAEAVRFMQHVQVDQDAGLPWAFVVAQVYRDWVVRDGDW